MKYSKILLLTLALAVSGSAWSQKLECRDFKVTDEAIARLKGTEMIDENTGQRAALIKIYTPFPNDVLGFNAGLFQILGRRQAGPGEVWLYVPERTQKITVTHPKYDPTVFWFEGMEAEAGKTYSIHLNVEGRPATLIASADNAEITVDGEPQGKSPVNMYLPLGSHRVRAELGSLLYEDYITLEPGGTTTFNLPMEDENLKFGDVDIVVPNSAELWFQDEREGIGELTKHLRAGSYVVTAKLADHEDQTTTFNVEAGKRKRVAAAPPVPHRGYLALVTEPAHGVTVMSGDTLFNLAPQMQLPVASYDLEFSKRGYYPQTRRFRVQRGETLKDTVVLQKIQYVKKSTGYASVAFALTGGKPGVMFALGGYYENVNLEASYTLGLGRGKEVEWFDRTDKVYYDSYTYRMDELAFRAGYQLRFAERFGLTPQTGILIQRLSAQDKNYPGNGFTQAGVPIAARLSFHPAPHLGIFLTPEYVLPVGEKGDIREVFSQAGLTRGGFNVAIGVSVSL